VVPLVEEREKRKRGGWMGSTSEKGNISRKKKEKTSKVERTLKNNPETPHEVVSTREVLRIIKSFYSKESVGKSEEGCRFTLHA